MSGVDHAEADEPGNRDAGGIDEYFQRRLLCGLGCRLFGIVLIAGRAASGHLCVGLAGVGQILRGCLACLSHTCVSHTCVGLAGVGLVERCCVVEWCCVAVCFGLGWCGGAGGVSAVAGEVGAGEALDVGEGGDAASAVGAWVIGTESFVDECGDALGEVEALFGG